MLKKIKLSILIDSKLNILIFYLIIISNFLFSNSQFKNNILLYIDPLNISTIVLDKYHPYQSINIKYYSLNIDGSVNMPLFHLYPETLHFNTNSVNSISQLSYKQNKNDEYFDTKIAFINNLSTNSNILTQLESKSLVENINQNAFMNINKVSKNLVFNASYLYHYDEESDQYELNINNAGFNKENETFATGYNIEYLIDNIILKSNLSFQTSYHKRPEIYVMNYENIIYEQRFFLFLNEFQYRGDNLVFFINNLNNDIIIEDNQSSTSFYDYHYNVPSMGVFTNFDHLNFNISTKNINKQYKANVKISYNKNNMILSIEHDNYLKGFLSDDQDRFGSYDYYEYRKNNFNIDSIFDLYQSSINIGEINSDYISYKYFLLGGEFDFNLLNLDYDYCKYIDKTLNLGVSEYLNIGISIFPLNNNFEFDLYGKINYYYYLLDSEINLLTMDLFQNSMNQNDTQLYNFEVGLIFDSFEISYVSKNLLSENISFSESITPFKRFDFIEIIWVFRD